MANAKVFYPQGTTFEKRIKEFYNDKIRVANEVAQQFLGPGCSTFIGDGSSTFYVGLQLFARGESANIYTNHLAIAHEYPLWTTAERKLSNIRVQLAGGTVEPDLMMTGGPETNETVSQFVKSVETIVLSVRYIFSDYGPTGVEQLSLEVKRKAIEAARNADKKIIFVTDYSKLSLQYANSMSPIYGRRVSWTDLIKNENVFIVTTKHPNHQSAAIIPREPRSELDWYNYHAKQLTLAMGDRFTAI